MEKILDFARSRAERRSRDPKNCTSPERRSRARKEDRSRRSRSRVAADVDRTRRLRNPRAEAEEGG